ncbi:MAG: hypothetical protein KIS77_00690 [Saprospiraceae bacterium]|nr:hypothetical protein [Saprospiraceae bacterium]
MKAIVHREEDRTKAILTSLLVHLGMLALLMFYKFSVPEKAIEPPPVYINIDMSNWGGGGDNAAQGQPDRGRNSTSAPAGDPTDVAEPALPAKVPPAEPKPTPPTPTPPAKTEPPVNTPTTEDPNVAALRRQQQEEAKRKQEEQDRLAAIERERIKKEQEAAAAKAREEQARRDRIKNSGLGTGGTGAGSGSGGNAGNQGIPGGTGSNPFGQSPGSGGGSGGGIGTGTGGSVGGGLGGRKVLTLAKADYDSNKQGTVRVRVCVNSDGTVVEADPTQSGSTTTDATLRSAARAAALKSRFAAEPGAEVQCGWIEYNFILK